MSKQQTSTAALTARWRQVVNAGFWTEVQNYLLLSFGTVVATLGYVLFQVPFNLAGGGLGSITIIINHYTGLPIGGMLFVMNLPLLVLGYFYLGRWRFVLKTLWVVVLFSGLTDLMLFYLPLLFH